MEICIGPFQFSSNFECGNLARVLPVQSPGSGQNRNSANTPSSNSGKKAPKLSVYAQNSTGSDHIDYEFRLWTKPDCFGTEFENNNRTWFCFCIRGGEAGQRVLLSVMNLNKQFKLYSQGMQPVVQCVGDCLQNSKWERIKEKCTYRSEENSTVISWVHTVPQENKATYYAFTYPYSYSDLQNYLENLEKNCTKNSSEIYYVRELVIKSIDGYRVDLLTISSHHKKTLEREDRLANLFPDLSTLRPYRFDGKKIVFVSARVHPGETPSSYVMNGFINFIVSGEPPARKLRDIFVFKIIPMLNPDGVIRGHYRTDQRGVNLNRVYINPSFLLHPSIYAAKKVILYHHYGAHLEMLVKSEEFSRANANLSKPSSENLYCNPSLFDEDTCHSFSDAMKNKHESSTVTSENLSIRCRPSLLEMDEPSASGWDCSSNLSVESSCRVGAFQPDSEEIHDECSYISCVSEGETGVTNMFRSLSPIREFKVNHKIETKLHCHHPLSCDDTLCSIRQENNLFGNPRNSSIPLNISHDPKEAPDTFLSRTKFVKDDVLRSDASDSVMIRPSVKESHCDQLESNGCRDSSLFMYVDLHGHASKRGIFMYGNWFEDTDVMIENMLLPKILSINCQNFDYGACNFSERNMYHRDRRDGMSKEGSGRVAIMRATGLLRSYTLECNYNTGRIVNPPSTGRPHKSLNTSAVPPKYSPAIFEDCGHKLGVSLFDLTEPEEFSRSSVTLHILKAQIHSSLLSSSNSPRIQHVPGSNSLSKTTLTRFSASKPPVSDQTAAEAGTYHATTSKVQSISALQKHTALIRSPPKLPRVYSTRKNSWTLSADSENQEPSFQIKRTNKTKKNDASASGSSHSKGKTVKLKSSLSPKKQVVSRSLYYRKDVGENSHIHSQEQSIKNLASSKHSLRASVCLTPNISFKVSISDPPDSPQIIKKLDRGRKQRSKTLKLVSKKLKTAIHMHCTDSETGSAMPISPRSPLASVCEPQTSQSTQSASSIMVQPKSPTFAKTSKSTYGAAKRPTKHTIKPLSKGVDRMSVVGASTGQRLKLLPKKIKKKSATSASSQMPLKWMSKEPLKCPENIDSANPNVKKRKKSVRKSL